MPLRIFIMRIMCTVNIKNSLLAILFKPLFSTLMLFVGGDLKKEHFIQMSDMSRCDIMRI